MSRIPVTLDQGELPLAELQAMRLDGEVFGLVDAWCPIDVVETPQVRTRAVMTARSERLVAARCTAAWIWGALPVLPRPIELCADVRARARLRPGADAVVHEYVLDDGDVVRFDASAVTAPLRTLVDVARSGAVGDDVLRALAQAGRIGLDEALASIQRRPLPGRRIARRALERALSPR
ncbi:hypothetical protein GCM10009840_22800 [Pseudolysinimonas kribbensis]|uniref:hypothetical protein n=1 Tax=Pseudolysinimonas kribbensis TaxID=433641 RepID=UPI0031D2A223